MKIVHVLNGFLPDQVAGTEMYVYTLISYLKELGISGIVVIPNYGKTTREEYFVDTIKVIKYAEPSVPDRSLMMGKRDPDGLPFFLEVLEAEKPDIVHFHELAGSNGITYRHVAVSKTAGFRNIMTFHLAGYSCKTGNLMYRDEEYCDGIIRIGRCSNCYYKVRQNNALVSTFIYPTSLAFYAAGINTTKWDSSVGTSLGFPYTIKKLKDDLLALANNCEALISLTSWYKDILVKNGIAAEKIEHIPQGLTVQTLSGIAKPQDESGKLKLIFVGRISKFKGLDLLIEALKGIGPDKISLDIYGPDPEDGYSIEMKKISSAMPNVHWKGLLRPASVSETISRYDVFCLPSAFSEMSPLVIQESFAAKVPVLASDVYGNAEQINNNKDGWLFRFKDVIDLREKLASLVNDPTLVKNAKKNIRPVRSFKEVAHDQSAVYQNIIKLS